MPWGGGGDDGVCGAALADDNNLCKQRMRLVSWDHCSCSACPLPLQRPGHFQPRGGGGPERQDSHLCAPAAHQLWHTPQVRRCLNAVCCGILCADGH